MLQQVKISRFKSIKDLTLDLGRVNIFVGANGSGKSNILEAIGIASASIYRGLGDSDLARKGIRLTPSELMKSAFKSEEVAQTFEISLKFEEKLEYQCNLIAKENDPMIRFDSESCSFEGVEIFGRGANGSKVLGEPVSRDLDKDRGMWDQIKLAHEFPFEIINFLDCFAKYSIFTPQTDVLRGIRTGYLDSSPFGLHGEGLALAVKKVVSDFSLAEGRSKDYIGSALNLAFLPGWTTGFRVGDLEDSLVSRGIQNKNSEMVYFIDRYMRENQNKLSLYDSSEGTLFLLFIAILLAHSESPRYFALDNVDNALNPLMTRKMLERIISCIKNVYDKSLDFGPKQVFLTSHNPTSLDAFDIFDETQRVFVVSRQEDGSTTANRLAPPTGMTRDEWVVEANGRNLSQLWLDEMIEGINGEVKI